jgi:hypothetical protein
LVPGSGQTRTSFIYKLLCFNLSGSYPKNNGKYSSFSNLTEFTQDGKALRQLWVMVEVSKDIRKLQTPKHPCTQRFLENYPKRYIFSPLADPYAQ